MRREAKRPKDPEPELMPESALALPGYEFSEAYRKRLREEADHDLHTMLGEPEPLI